MADNIQRIEELKRELAGNPQSRQFYQLGELLRREGRNADAAEVLRAGVAFHPKYVAAWVALGRAWLEIDRSADAAQALESALALDRQNPVAWRLLGEARLAAGDRWGGLEAMGRALELVPGDEVLMAAVEALAGQTAPPSEPVPLFSSPRPVVATPPATPVSPPAPVAPTQPEQGTGAPPVAPAPLPDACAPEAFENEGRADDDSARGESGVALPPPAADPFAMIHEAEPLGVAADWDVFAEPAEMRGGEAPGDVFAEADSVAAAAEDVEVEPSIEAEPSVEVEPASAEQPVSAEELPSAEEMVSAEEPVNAEEPVSAEEPPAARGVSIETTPPAVIAPESELPAGPPAALQLPTQFPDETPSAAAEAPAAAPAEDALVVAGPSAPLPEESAQFGSEPLVESPEDREGAGDASAAAEAGERDAEAGAVAATGDDANATETPVWVDVDVSGDSYAAAPAAPTVAAPPPPAGPPEADLGQVSVAGAASEPADLALPSEPEAAGEAFAAAAAESAEPSGAQAGLFDAAAQPSVPVGEPLRGEESGQAAEQAWLPATMTMARLLIQQQQLDGAVEVLARVIAREPGNEEAADLLELVRDMMQPDAAPLPPLSMRSRKIAALQRWQASMTLGRERVAP